MLVAPEEMFLQCPSVSPVFGTMLGSYRSGWPSTWLPVSEDSDRGRASQRKGQNLPWRYCRPCLLSRLVAFPHLLPHVRYLIDTKVIEGKAIVKMALTKPTSALDNLFLVDGNLLLITLETGSPRSKRYQILSGERQFFINDAMCPHREEGPSKPPPQAAHRVAKDDLKLLLFLPFPSRC